LNAEIRRMAGKAVALDPDNADAYYDRGLLHQHEKQYQSEIDDFTAASGLVPQQAEPLLARALSYLALDKPKEAAKDLDEAVQDEPQNAQAWITRGLAYERLGDKTRAAGCYARAIICALGTRRHVPALSASAASPARAKMRSDSDAVRSEATARQSANCWRPPLPFCSCSLPGKTAWNIDLAAANTSWATVFACEAALAASARRSSRGRGGGISAGGIGRFGSLAGTEAV
jgi:tetratricopeptide (TPR) repeat protein